MNISNEELKYLELLSESYGTIGEASTEIINLQAIQSLPKGTEIGLHDMELPGYDSLLCLG